MAEVLLKIPDSFGAMQRGIQTGRTTNEYVRGEQNRKLGEELAPAIMSGDTAAYEQLAAKDKPRADEYQSEYVKRLKQLGAAGKYMQDAIASGDKVRIAAAWKSGARPLLARIVKDKPIPEEWSDEMLPALEEAMAMVSKVDMTEGASAGQKEFEAKARAAGLRPGTPEYENAAKVALGVNPRAVTGAIKFDTITDAQGRPRPQRNNPSTGGVEVYQAETDSWVPLGAGEGAPAVAPTGAPTNSALPPGGTQAVADQVAQKAEAFVQQLRAANVPPEQINAMSEQYIAALNSGLSAAGGVKVETPGMAPAAGTQGVLGVGRPKEAEEAAKTAATGTMRTLSADEVASQGLPPGTFAQVNALTGEVKVGGNNAQRQPGELTGAQKLKLKKDAAKAKGALASTIVDLDRMAAAVRDIKSQETGLKRTTGIYSIVPSVPAIPGLTKGEAKNVELDLDALKSQIGFSVLQNMRLMSPTGGSLGNVSNEEGLRLERNLAALETAQSYEEMQKSLDVILSYVDASKARLQGAYDEQFGEAENYEPESSTPAATGGWGIRKKN